jgi:NADP-dependent 3-hydroxy acid dehydrogenase YdfG/Tfp pilus assembly protein PilF
MSKKIALAYSIENIEIAESVEQVLKLAGYAVQHVYGKQDDNAASVSQQLRSQNAPILLLVSDNFLKSPKCMDEGLKLLGEKKDYILPVVIDGKNVGALDGQNTITPTRFERVSDIIQYINYWQDQYLDLRRQKREIKDIDEANFNQHLKTMRTISSEVGEFLRNLRTLDYVYYKDFMANDYEALFEFTNDPVGWQTVKNSELPKVEASTPSESIDQTQPESGETVDLSGIPGYDIIKPEPVEDEVQPPVEEGASEEPEQEITLELPVEEPEIEANIEEDNLILSDNNSDDEEVEENTASEGAEQPDSPEVLEEDNEDEDEKEDYEEEEKEDNYDLSAAILSAYELIEAGNEAAALSFLQNEIEEQPEIAELRYHYALMLVQKDDVEAAKEELDEVLKLAPEHTDALFLRADLATVQEDYSLAYKLYKNVLTEDPEYSDIYYRIGNLLAKHFDDKAEKAAKYLKKAIRQNPGNIDALYQYGVLLNEELDKENKAAKYLKRVIELNPQHPFAHYDLALIFHKDGDEIMSKQYYLKAIEINPELHTEENDIAFGIITIEEEIVQEPESNEYQESTANGSANATSSGSDAVEILNPPSTIEIKEEVSEVLDLELESTDEATEVEEEQVEEEIAVEAKEEQVVQKPVKTILITGATSGIGRATAEIFAQNGYKVIITGRRAEKLEELQSKLQNAFDAQVHTLPFDVRDIESVQNAIDSLDKEWKQIDILVNNAGKAKGLAPIHEGELRHWEEMIDTNLKGLLYLTRAVSPHMVERRQGQIINICSTAGKEVYPNGNVYCATKHAVDALTKAMRIDLHKYNIRVGQVSPGHVEETEFAEVRFDGDKERAKIYDDFMPLTARDVAATIYFIASCPAHVNIQDILMMGTQQANSIFIDRSGRND